MQEPTARRVWDTALGQLQLQVTRPNYDTWLKDTLGLSAENGTFTVGTPSDFVSEWLSAKMGPVIARTVGSILGHEVSIRYQVIGTDGFANGHANGHGPDAGHNGGGSAAIVAPPTGPPRGLNGSFTFDRFIIGNSNRLAAAAALASADKPGKAYNPLFIYGSTGLGKTHLLHAVAHRAGNGSRNVVYTTSEQFTNDFVNAIAQGRQEDFRRHYRSADLLLIDDIQFLAGKDRTQEEFFHTFNDLQAAGCQLIITSDRCPKAITDLEGRLCSRFHSGLIADIQPPDEETRLAILRAKASEQRVNIPTEVAHIIVQKAHENVRELEGLLNRVTAYASLTRSPINVQLAQQAINALTPPQPSAPPTPEKIIGGVACYFHISAQAIAGPSRAKPIAEARHFAMYLLREDAQLPLKAIGRLLGNRDHSTVIHGCRKATSSLANPKGRQQLAEIRSLIPSS